MNWLNSLMGIMGQLGRFIPNYVEGYRNAWADNWRDANQYNVVQNGQMQNAFASQAFPLEYNMLADRAGMSRINSLMNANNFYDYLMQEPARQTTIDFYNQNLPSILQAQGMQITNPGYWQGTQQSTLMNILNQNGLLPGQSLTTPQQTLDPIALFNQQVG